jgi:hypothetical protein
MYVELQTEFMSFPTTMYISKVIFIHLDYEIRYTQHMLLEYLDQWLNAMIVLQPVHKSLVEPEGRSKNR